jgi:RHS repeat-associated protein
MYDSIYRLSQVYSVDASSSWGAAWTFDIWGNRLTQTPQGLASGKIGSQITGYTNNRTNGFNYDPAGNQTSDGLHNYTFSAENQIVSVDGGAVTFGYDGEKRRVKKTVGSETTYYFYASIEGIGLISEFTTTNTGATQAASTDKTRYRVADPGGTATLIIDASGLCIENNRTLPYGESWSAQISSTTDNKFSTYVRDPESGLDYAMMRYYASANGRFMSVDPNPEHMDFEYPQTLNAYTYVINNPINFDDQNGEFLGPIFKAIGNWFLNRFRDHQINVSIKIHGVSIGYTVWTGSSHAVERMRAAQWTVGFASHKGFSNDCNRTLGLLSINGVRVTGDSLQAAVRAANLVDGTTLTNFAYADLLKNADAASYAAARQKYGNKSVAQVLAENPSIIAAAQFKGNLIVINPANVSNNMKYLSGLIMHEVLHNMGFGDTGIQLAFFGQKGVSPNTTNINERLQKDCIK